MITVDTAEFKAHCLDIIANMSKTGEDVLVIRNGRPLARVTSPHLRQEPKQIFGALKGWIKTASAGDDLFSAYDKKTMTAVEKEMLEHWDNVQQPRSNKHKRKK